MLWSRLNSCGPMKDAPRFELMADGRPVYLSQETLSHYSRGPVQMRIREMTLQAAYFRTYR